MNDSEWFHCNPDRLVRRRRLPGDPETWIISLHDTSETLLVHGRLPAIDDSDEALHVVATELLLEGVVDADRIQQALQIVLEASPVTGSNETSRAGVDSPGTGGPGGPRVVWPTVPGRESAAREQDLMDEI